MATVKWCDRCAWRTRHELGVCLDCSDRPNEVPDKTLEEQGQVPLFPFADPNPVKK